MDRTPSKSSRPGRFAAMLATLQLALAGAEAAEPPGAAAVTHDDVVERRNIETMRTLFAVINRSAEPAKDPELLGTFRKHSSPNLVRHDLTGMFSGVRGHDGAIEFTNQLKDGFSDLHLNIEEILASDDRVIIRFVTTGTHDGPFLGRPPTGNRIQVNNINVYRFEEGLLVETWQLYDALTLMRQLELVPPEPAR